MVKQSAQINKEQINRGAEERYHKWYDIDWHKFDKEKKIIYEEENN